MKSRPHSEYSNKNSLLASCMLVIALTFSPMSEAFQQPAKTQSKEINKNQAAQKAKQTVKGRVLRVEQGKKNYRVKMLKKSGRVVSVDVDKKSGKVVNTKKKGKQE